jgi:hypothetical protein
MLTNLGLLASEYEGSTLLQISVNNYQSTGRFIADNLKPDQHHCGNLKTLVPGTHVLSSESVVSK